MASRFFSNITLPEQLTLSYAVGRAAGPALAPFVQDLANAAWKLHPDLPPDAYFLASGVAQGQVSPDQAREWAKENGYDDGAFDALISVASTGPALGLAYQAWRRDQLTEAEFRTAVKRQGIEPEWVDALVALKDETLDPSQTAAAIHRGLIPDPGLLKGEQPTGPRKVEAYPVYPLHALDEAAAHGYDHDRLGVLVGLQGLPMGTHEAAQAYFRSIITHGDYIAAFNESNSRNEWAQAVLDYSRQIPTARDFLENALRGYRSLDQALRGAALHGMSVEDATMIYQNQGRPMNVHAITQALARGAKFKPEPGEITDPYDAAIVEGNLKPAYYDLQKALRYTMPSVFAIRTLAQSGVWDEAKTEERLLWSGWLPEDAADVAKAWAGGASTGAGSHVTKAQNQLWTAQHKAYVGGNSDETQARDNLTAIGVPTDEQTQVLALWDREKALTRKEPTVAQLKKAYVDGLMTREDVQDELLKRGYTLTAVTLLLAEWDRG